MSPTVSAVRFGKTTWLRMDDKKSVQPDNNGQRYFSGYANVDRADFRRHFPFGVLPKLNRQYEPLKPRDGIDLSLSLHGLDREVPRSLDELKPLGRFSISFLYTERGVPKNYKDWIGDYASGYEIQEIDSQQKALGFFNYLDKASLPGGKATVDLAKETLFLDVLMRAANGFRGKMDKDDANRLLYRWSTQIGRDGKNVQLPPVVARPLQRIPAALGRDAILNAALEFRKKQLQKALFTQLVKLALPATAPPHRGYFSHTTNPVPASVK